MTPRPTFPIAGYALAAAVVIGLLALSIAAYTAFSSVMEWYHALFAAGVVEVGAVVESLALARARSFTDGALALLAVVASVVVSATYNYTQVAQAAAKLNISQWELTALALGPLVALVFLSLNFGRVLRAHEQAVTEWQKAQSTAAANEAAAKARADDNARYDAQRAAEREANRRHELALAELQSRATAQLAPIAVGGGEVQDAQSTAQRVAQWRADNPQGTKTQCAVALGVHPSTVGRNWK